MLQKYFGSLPQASHNNLGKFWVNLTWVNFGPLNLTRTRFFSSAPKMYIRLRSELCDGHSNTLPLLSLTSLGSFGTLPFQKVFSAKAEHIIMLGQQLVTESIQPFYNQREVSQKAEI